MATAVDACTSRNPSIIDEEESAVPLQRPSDSSAELIADERRDRMVGQIEVVLRIERRVPIQFPQRPVKLVTTRPGCHIDDRAAMPAVLGIESLGQNLDLFQLIQAKEKTRRRPQANSPSRIGGIHAIDQDVRHTRTYPINCHLPGLTVRKQ